MAFVNVSIELKKNNYTLLNNSFITNFLADAPENSIKVYLQGLYYTQLNSDANTINNFCEDLKLTKKQVIKAFEYWENQNLIKISNLDDFEIIYLPIDNKTINFTPIDEGKYSEFFILCQNLLERNVTPIEFKDYIDLIEKSKLEQDALLMIIKYCTNYKDKNINAKYIISTARNWIGEGILTTKSVEEKIKDLEKTSEQILNILTILGIKRSATLEERDLYLKWTKDFHYTDKVILTIAESLKKKGGMKALDNKILKYHSMQYFSIDEIETYEKHKKYYNSLAKDICSKLGVYIENLEPVVDNYLNEWLTKGFSDETLKLLATFCFKTNHNSLDKMDLVIQKLFKQGYVSLTAISQYIGDLNDIDKNIKNIFDTLSIARNITSRDREIYNTWCNEWKISTDILNYAVEISNGKTQPWLYLNKVLSNFHEKNITTLEEAKQQNFDNISNKTSATMYARSYTDDELNRLFDNLKEIDV